MINEFRHIRECGVYINQHMDVTQAQNIELIKCIVLAEILEKLCEIDDNNRERKG